MKLRLPNKLIAAIVAAASPVLFSTLSTATLGAAAVVTVAGQQAQADGENGALIVNYTSQTSGRTDRNASLSKSGSTDTGTGSSSYTGAVNLNDFTAAGLTSITISGSAANTESIATIADNGGFGGRVSFSNTSSTLSSVTFNKGIEANLAGDGINNASKEWVFDNASFYLGSGSTVNANVVVNEGGVRMNGSSGTSYTMNGSVSGTGDFFMCTGNNGVNIKFTGDLSGFSGAFYSSNATTRMREVILGDGGAADTVTGGTFGGSIGKSDAVYNKVTLNYTGNLNVNGSIYASTLNLNNLDSLTVKGTLDAATINNNAESDITMAEGSTLKLYNTDIHKALLTSSTGKVNVTNGGSVILSSAVTTQATGTLTINKVRTGNTDYDFYIGQDNGTRDSVYDLSSFTKVILGNDAVMKYHSAGSTLNNVTLSEGNASILIRDMANINNPLNLAGTTDLGSHTLTIGATTNNSWKRGVAIASLSGTADAKLVFAGGVTSDGTGSKISVNSLQSFSGTLELKEQNSGNPLTATIQTGTGNAVSLKALNFVGTGEVANINVQKNLVIDSVSVNASSEIHQQTTNGGTITIKKLLGGGDNVQLMLDSNYARDGKAFTYVIGAADETYNDDNLFNGTLRLTVSDSNQGSGSGTWRAVNMQVQAADVLKNTVVKMTNWAAAYNNSREILSLMTDAKVAGITGIQDRSNSPATYLGSYIRTGELSTLNPSTPTDMVSTGDARTLEITGSGNYESDSRIMGNVNLLMSGSGSQTFSGNMSDFNGDLTVTNGALKFTAAAPLNFGSVSVKNGTLSIAQVANSKAFLATVGNGARIELGSLGDATWQTNNLIQLTKETGATDMSTVTVVAGGTVAYNTNQNSDAANSTNLNGAKLVLKDGSNLLLRNTAGDGSNFQKGGEIGTGASTIELEGTTHLSAYSYITGGKTTITDTFTSKEGATTKLDINAAGTKFNMSGNITVGELAVQAGTAVMKDNTVTADVIRMNTNGVELSSTAKAVVGSATISAAKSDTNALMNAVSINATGIAKNGESAASISGADISVSKGEYAISDIALSDTKINALHGDSAAAVTVDGGNIGDNVSLDLKWGTSITFLNQATTINLNDMFIGSGAAVSGYTEGAINEAQEGTIHVVGTLTATDNSKVNANLTFGQGAKLNITGSTGVIMGSAVTFATGNDIQLTGAAADTLASFTLAGQHLTLFSGVDVFNVGGTAYNADELVGTTTTIKDFSSYIDLADHKYDNVREHLVLKFDVPAGSQQGGAVYLWMETPEPATATLSLLALAALAARRKRK